MSEESVHSPEAPQYNREKIIELFRKIPKEGVVDPAELSMDDPDVKAAYDAYFDWNKRELERAKQDADPKAMLEYSLSRSTLHYDSGFEHPDYLDEVANDWLNQDLVEAEQQGFVELAARIKTKIDEINQKIEE
jgi:hypothetical protein